MSSIEVKNEKGQTIKLEVEICPSCKSKVWPSLAEHMKKTCPDSKKEIEIFCRRCKGLIKVIDGTREEMDRLTNYLHVYTCDRCRKLVGKRSRPRQSRATNP